MKAIRDNLESEIAKVNEVLAKINADLRAMPDHKRNTRFHTDRTAERRRLLAQLDALVARQHELSLSN